MTTPTIKLAIPQLPSADLNTTERFFVDLLGFALLSRQDAFNFMSVQRGNAEIHFWKAPDVEYAKRIGSNSSCYLIVENIEPLYRELKQRGAPFRYELKVMPWGMHEMQIDDPYGNAIRFGER